MKVEEAKALLEIYGSPLIIYDEHSLRKIAKETLKQYKNTPIFFENNHPKKLIDIWGEEGISLWVNTYREARKALWAKINPKKLHIQIDFLEKLEIEELWNLGCTLYCSSKSLLESRKWNFNYRFLPVSQDSYHRDRELLKNNTYVLTKSTQSIKINNQSKSYRVYVDFLPQKIDDGLDKGNILCLVEGKIEAGSFELMLPYGERKEKIKQKLGEKNFFIYKSPLEWIYFKEYYSRQPMELLRMDKGKSYLPIRRRETYGDYIARDNS